MSDNLAATEPPEGLDAASRAWVGNMIWANAELLKQRSDLRQQGAVKDEAIESLRRTLNHNLERAEQLTAELTDARADERRLGKERDEARTIARKLRSYLDIWVDADLVRRLDATDPLPAWLAETDAETDDA